MTLEGHIRIRLAWDGSRISDAQIASRPLAPITTLLRGKQSKDALHILPLLFSLCGKAQAAAAATALEAAASNSIPAIPLQRERNVLAEALQEMLWRLLLDLPRIMNSTPAPERLAELRRQLADCMQQTQEAGWQSGIAVLEAAAGNALLGLPELSWECLDALDRTDTNTAHLLAACLESDRETPHSTVPLMPFANRRHMMEDMLPSLRDPAFPSSPTWRGTPAETGALARMQQCPPIAHLLEKQGPTPGLRLLARLAEIGNLFARLRAMDVPENSFVQGAPCGDGEGIAWAQNARGLLIHHVTLDKHGAIAEYCLVAPTEWNFHPQGACAQGLRGMPAASLAEARQKTELLVHSLDPCVAYQIEVDHA